MILKQIDRSYEGYKGVISEIGSSCIELVDALLLELDVDLFDLELGHRVYLLDVKVGRHAVLVLFVVLFGLLYVEWTVHDLDVHFQASRLLLKVGKRKAPMGTLYMNRIALFVEIIGQAINRPDKKGLFRVFPEGVSRSLLGVILDYFLLLDLQQLKNGVHPTHSQEKLY